MSKFRPVKNKSKDPRKPQMYKCLDCVEGSEHYGALFTREQTIDHSVDVHWVFDKQSDPATSQIII